MAEVRGDSEEEYSIVDLTEDKMYQVFASMFEDDNGVSITTHIAALTKAIEAQNKIIMKLLKQLMQNDPTTGSSRGE